MTSTPARSTSKWVYEDSSLEQDMRTRGKNEFVAVPRGDGSPARHHLEVVKAAAHPAT
jgi:hypothetical protein